MAYVGTRTTLSRRWLRFHGTLTPPRIDDACNALSALVPVAAQATQEPQSLLCFYLDGRMVRLCFPQSPDQRESLVTESVFLTNVNTSAGFYSKLALFLSNISKQIEPLKLLYIDSAKLNSTPACCRETEFQLPHLPTLLFLREDRTPKLSIQQF